MELRHNEQRAKNAIILIWIVMVVEILSLFSSYLQLELLQSGADVGYISEEAAKSNDSRERIVGIFGFIAYGISMITFIMWFRRAYYNLHQKVKYLSFSEGWAAGSWFVPIVNLYRPYQIMEELYVKTKKLLKTNGFSDRINYTTNYLNWWWTLWIITAVAGNIILKYALKYADTIDELIIITVGQMILSILEVPLAIITVKIIKDYSQVEPLLFEIKDDSEISQKQ
jgi:hypothetical protein